MKTVGPSAKKLWCSVIISLCVVAAHGVDNETRLKREFEALEAASGVRSTRIIHVPINAPIQDCEIAVEGYKSGKVAFNHYKWEVSGSNTIKSDPPRRVKIVTVCTSLREEEPMEFKPSEDTRTLRHVPGTGSTRLGYSFTWVWDSGRAITRGHLIVPHTDVDFYLMGNGVPCEDGGFTVVGAHHGIRSVPVVAYFPRTFVTQSLKGPVDVKNLPDGTVVVYARFK